MTLDVVIVNWNAGPQLRACLESMGSSRTDGFTIGKVVVVDNASTDGSLAAVDGLDLPLLVHRNAENRGFAAACNQGAVFGSGDAILFLNPDARLYPDTMDDAVCFLASHPRAGVCGVALEGDRGAVQRSCCRAPSAGSFVVKALGLDRLPGARVRTYTMDEWPHGETRRVDHVIGAFYLVRRTVFEALAGFDERFFVYLEDLDFSVRAAAAGWECWYLASSRAYHGGGGTSERAKDSRLFYSLRSRLQYASKHFGPGGAAAVWFSTLVVEPVVRVGAAAARLQGARIGETLQGYLRLWAWAVNKR